MSLLNSQVASGVTESVFSFAGPFKRIWRYCELLWAAQQHYRSGARGPWPSCHWTSNCEQVEAHRSWGKSLCKETVILPQSLLSSTGWQHSVPFHARLCVFLSCLEEISVQSYYAHIKEAGTPYIDNVHREALSLPVKSFIRAQHSFAVMISHMATVFPWMGAGTLFSLLWSAHLCLFSFLPIIQCSSLSWKTWSLLTCLPDIWS